MMNLKLRLNPAKHWMQGLLPVRVYKGRAHELVVAEKNLTYDEMTAAANAKLDAEMKSSIPKDARIIGKINRFHTASGRNALLPF